MVSSAGTGDFTCGLSIVIPVYNGAKTIEALAEKIDATRPVLPAPCEVILVNDASEDNSWAKIVLLARRYKFVRGIDLARNVGQHNALLCGIRLARYELTATIDDDLQHAPCDIPRLIRALNATVDVVYGLPTRQHHSKWRILTSHILGKMLTLSENGRASRYTAFRVFRTHLRDAFGDRLPPSVSIDVLLSWGTSRYASVDVEDATEARGRSRYSLRKLVALAIDMLHGFGVIPPGLAIGFGALCTTAGAILLLVGMTASAHTAPRDFAASTVTIAVLWGLQIGLIGWFGTYLSRIYHAVTGRPPYVIARTTSHTGNPAQTAAHSETAGE